MGTGFSFLYSSSSVISTPYEIKTGLSIIGDLVTSIWNYGTKCFSKLPQAKSKVQMKHILLERALVPYSIHILKRDSAKDLKPGLTIACFRADLYL